MYFPYLRGRQFELIAVRELAAQNLLGDHVIPIIEPVKLSSTLVNTMTEFIKVGHPIAVILNPSVGTFYSEWENAKENSSEALHKRTFIDLYNNPSIIKSLIMNNSAMPFLNAWEKKDIPKSSLLIINTDRDFLDIYDDLFKDEHPRYVLMPDESAFRRKIKGEKVLLDDKFEKQARNADYQHENDEFFSDDHLYYKGDGFTGFSDYSVVGDGYFAKGFAPYAVAIHIVYFGSKDELRIRHFVSKSNEDILNPALKYYEALSKLVEWYEREKHSVELTLGLKTFLQHYEQETYPGLGTVKKLSIMHHLELMGKFLAR